MKLAGNRETGLKIIGFTQRAEAALKLAGANDGLLHDLAVTVWNLKRSRYDIDTSDNAVSCLGVQLSFIRDNRSGEVTILLPDEAKKLNSVGS